MADLYPTPNRLKLLAQIDNSQVLTDITRDDDEDVIWLFPDAPTSWDYRVKVTARARELEAAGWAEDDAPGLTWSLTGAGQKVLEASRRD